MKYFVLLSVIVCGLCSGCSFFNTSRQIVAVNVQPSDANIIINGLSYPGGSIYAEVPRSREVLIEVWKDKFLTEKYIIPFKLSSTGVMDACGAILILPAFGLFSSGAWKLEKNVVHIALMPDPLATTKEIATDTDEPEKTKAEQTEPVEIDKTMEAVEPVKAVDAEKPELQAGETKTVKNEKTETKTVKNGKAGTKRVGTEITETKTIETIKNEVE